GARVAVVAVERRPRSARAARAGLVAVAHGRILARGPIGHRDVLAARLGIAGVERAEVQVVAIERRTRRARAALTGLRAVADRRVEAGSIVGGRRVRASAHRVARVRRARVAVVAYERGAGRAEAVLTGLGAVADGVVGARRAIEHRDVLAARLRVARVGRA